MGLPGHGGMRAAHRRVGQAAEASGTDAFPSSLCLPSPSLRSLAVSKGLFLLAINRPSHWQGSVSSHSSVLHFLRVPRQGFKLDTPKGGPA